MDGVNVAEDEYGCGNELHDVSKNHTIQSTSSLSQSGSSKSPTF
jgi:hypothetical protein